MIYASAIIAGILNGLMDDWRDRFGEHYFRRWSYFNRTPADRVNVPFYGAFILTDRVIEWFNDAWHLYKALMFVALFVGLVGMQTVSDGLICLGLFAFSFEIVYHRWFNRS